MDYTVRSSFGNIKLTPLDRDEISLQTFWPCRALKVDGREIYATVVYRRDDAGVWQPSPIRMSDLRAKAPAAPKIRARVLDELTRLASKWARNNAEELEETFRRTRLELARDCYIRGEKEGIETAIETLSVCADELAGRDRGTVLAAADHLREFVKLIPMLECIIERIPKPKVAA